MGRHWKPYVKKPSDTYSNIVELREKKGIKVDARNYSLDHKKDKPNKYALIEGELFVEGEDGIEKYEFGTEPKKNYNYR